MFLSYWCIDSNNEKIEEIFVENTSVVMSSPRDYNLCNKGLVPNSSSSQEGNIPLKNITPHIPTPKPSIPTYTKEKNKSNLSVTANTNKPSTSKSTRNNAESNTMAPNNKTCDSK
jgi:hypothetical protein